MTDDINLRFSRTAWMVVFTIFTWLLLASYSYAAVQDCTLTWAANTEADLNGYHIYAQSKGPGQYVKGQYQGTVDKSRTSAKCGSDIRLTAPGLYHFVLTAFDTNNNESAFSDEVSRALAEIPAIGAPGIIENFTVTGDIGALTVSLTVPNDGTGKLALIDVRYEEGTTIGWGGATQFACLSFPCKIIGLKQGMAYTVQAIPVRRVTGSPSVFGIFTLPQSTKTLTDIIIPPVDPPIDPPPDKPRMLEVSMLEKDGLIILTFKKEDLLK